MSHPPDRIATYAEDALRDVLKTPPEPRPRAVYDLNDLNKDVRAYAFAFAKALQARLEQEERRQAEAHADDARESAVQNEDVSPEPEAATERDAVDEPDQTAPAEPLPTEVAGTDRAETTPEASEDAQENTVPPELKEPDPLVQRLRGNLPEAPREGTPFSTQVDLPPKLKLDSVRGLEESGLTFDRSTGTLRGDAPRPGTYHLELRGDLNGARAIVEIPFSVSPDPWSLWNDIPSDPTMDFHKPDVEAAHVSGDLILLAASHRGRKHAHTGAPRDDHAGVAATSDGWHIGVVADGAGSAIFSREGSRVAVDTVLRVLPELLANYSTAETLGDDGDRKKLYYNTLASAALEAAEAVEARESETDSPPGSMATTLIVGAAKQLPNGRWSLATFAVGDGLASAFDPREPAVHPLITPDSGEYAGQTRFLSRELFADPPAILSRVHVIEMPDPMALVLMTDGVSDALFPTPLAEKDAYTWAAFWDGHVAPSLRDAPKDSAEALTKALNFKVKGEHDDRSLVVMLPTDLHQPTETED